MMFLRHPLAATVLMACASIATSASPKPDPARKRLLSSFEKAGLYQPPEVPPGCLEWKGAPKGDSVLFTSRVLSKPACKDVEPLVHRWILPRKGGMPFLVEGPERTSLSDLTGVDLPEEEPDRLLTNRPKNWQEDDVDIIVAGGGGSMKKGERYLHDEEQDRSRADGTGLGVGGRSGFGVRDDSRRTNSVMEKITAFTGEEGGTRKRKMALGAGGSGKGPTVRALVAPPTASDVEIVGESPSRSKESILRVIRQHVGGFQYTYQKFLRQFPELEGTLSFKFTIAPSGQILSVLISKSTTGDQDLDFEIKNKAERMMFDAIEAGEVTVVYHLSLRRQPREGTEAPGKPSPAPFHTSTGSPTSRVDVREGKGLRTPESILRVLIQGSGGFKYTFQKYLRDQPDLDPKFGVRLTIDASGAVLDASTDKSTTGNKEADEELIGKFRNLKFDSIDQGQVKLVYRFDLSK